VHGAAQVLAREELAARGEASGGVDHGAHAAVRGAHHEAVVLDRPHARDGQVDPGLVRVAEPGVVREHHEQVRLRLANHAAHEAGQRGLVADRRRHAEGAEHERRRRVGRAEGLRVREESAQRALEGEPLREGHEHVLVVAGADRAVRAHEEGRVVLEPSPVLGDPHRGRAEEERQAEVAADRMAGDRQRALDAARVHRLGPDDEVERFAGEELARLREVRRVRALRVAALGEHVRVALHDPDA
jgi:hypothetical protein